MNRISLTTLTGQNISAPLSVLTYTADEDREISFQVYASGLAGGGVYKAVLVKQLGGIGTAYQSMTSGVAVSFPVTTVFMPGMSMPVKSGDVVKVYLEGLAADIAIGVEVEVFDVSGGGGGDVTLADGAIKAVTFDQSTAFPLAKIDSGATEIARTGADSDTLETLSDEIAAVSAAIPSAATIADAVWDEASTGHTSTGKAGEQLWTDVDALATTLTAIKGAGWTTETLVAIDVLLDAIRARTDLIEADVEITIAGAVEGSTITIRRGDTLAGLVTGLGSLAGFEHVDFGVKENEDDDDDDAVVWVRKSASGTDGLLYLNGEAASAAGDGEITIDDEADGDVTIRLAADATKGLQSGTYVYDIQVITSSLVRTLATGTCKITRDVIRAVS